MTGLMHQVKKVFCVTGFPNVIPTPSLMLPIAKIETVYTITVGNGNPILDAIIVIVPLTKLITVAVNNPKGTIFSLDVFNGPVKMNAPNPNKIPMIQRPG